MPQILKSKSLIIFFIYLTVIYLAVCDFFLPFKYESSEWLPIFSGYLDLDYLYSNNILMGILGMLFISLIPISIYLISIKLSNVSIELKYIIPLSLLICFVSPNGFYFSSIYIVSLAIPWLFYLVINKKLFLSGLLISLVSLFYLPFIFLSLIFIIYSAYKSNESLKGLVIGLSGVLLPILYLLFFRYLFFDDVKEFILLCYSNLALMPPSIFPISAAKLFVNICFILIAIHAVFYVINEINRYNKIKDFILRLSILSLVVYVIIYALYGGDTSYNLPLLITTPLSIILSGYFESNNDKYLSKGELVLLLCAAIVYRTSIFLI